MHTTDIKKPLKVFLILSLYIFFIGICLTIFQYLSFKHTEGFLAFKQDLINNKLWLNSFYIHVFTCFICLLAGFTQFSSTIRNQYHFLHRLIGRIYVYNILFINFPIALLLSLYANGHLLGRTAFILLDILWLYYTFAGVYWIKRDRVLKHQNFMLRSYALTLSALSLRMCRIVMTKLVDWDDDSIYIFDAWFALIFNLIIAETIIFARPYLLKNK